jgi:hypothetical protein
MFNSLLGLHTDRVPLEDFTTEALCGVLSSNQEILNTFVNKVLKVSGNGYSVITQKSYPGSRIDMVFENAESIIFLENKVGSEENHEQLSKYAKLLCDQDKKHYLRFCTKFLEVKEPNSYFPLEKAQFYQFRWTDVYYFFSNDCYVFDSLIKYFLNFLEQNEMSKASEFTIDDLVAMRRFPSTFKSMEESINVVVPRFQELFGISKCTKTDVIKQLSWHNRYARWQDDLLDGGYSEILFGFNLGEQDHKYPLLNIHVWITKGHELYESVLSDIDSNKDLLPEIIISKNDYGFSFSYKEPLSNFIANNNQFESIQTWFEDKIQIIHAYMTSSKSNVSWNVKNNS